MKKSADHSAEHFDWLIEGRSRNQRSALTLYKLVGTSEDALLESAVLQDSAHRLVAIVFSCGEPCS